MEEYSVIKPATNSDSASDKSKGTLFDSPKRERKKTRKKTRLNVIISNLTSIKYSKSGKVFKLLMNLNPVNHILEIERSFQLQIKINIIVVNINSKEMN